MKRHQPYHLYLDGTVYFLTSHTYRNSSYFDSNNKKSFLLKKIREVFNKFDYKLYAWVMLNNHYHLEFKTRVGKDLPKIMNHIHGSTSFMLNKDEEVQGRKVWQNYWDHCVRGERDFWMHFNYIHHNPVKHGYVKSMSDYKFSSYQYYLSSRGEGWLMSCFKRYPIVDFTVDGDEFEEDKLRNKILKD